METYSSNEKMNGAVTHLEKSIGDESPSDEYLGNEAFIEEVDYTPEEEKKILFKVDCYLLITIFWMYLLSYMDRTNVGNAKVAGMEEDLSLTSTMYSNVLIVFFIFYVIFEVPANLIMVKVGPSIFIPTIMVIWGVLTCCMAAVKTYGQLVALRALVGIFEAGFAPGILLILSSWYKKKEQSKAFAVYILAAILSGAVGGIIAGLITKHLHLARGIEGWRWLFIVEGAASVAIAIIAYFTLLPLPQNLKPGRRFTQREISIAFNRLKNDDIDNDDGDHISPLNALLTNLKSYRVILLIIGYMVIVGSSTLSYFYPTLVEGLGYEGDMIQYMTIPIYGAAFVLNLGLSFFSDKFIHLRGWFLTGLLFCAGVFSVVVVTCYGYTTRYAMLCLMASCLWASNSLALSYAASILADKDSKTRGVGLALINALGNLAQIYGSYLFPSKDQPKYLMGFGVITGMCFLGFINYIFISIYVRKKFRNENRLNPAQVSINSD